MKNLPIDILENIKRKSKIEWPDDYEIQLHVIEEQSDAYLIIKQLENELINEDVFIVIKESAQREWPDDYEMQLYYIKEQITSLSH